MVEIAVLLFLTSPVLINNFQRFEPKLARRCLIRDEFSNAWPF
jgi:hypothetical protein